MIRQRTFLNPASREPNAGMCSESARLIPKARFTESEEEIILSVNGSSEIVKI